MSHFVKQVKTKSLVRMKQTKTEGDDHAHFQSNHSSHTLVLPSPPLQPGYSRHHAVHAQSECDSTDAVDAIEVGSFAVHVQHSSSRRRRRSETGCSDSRSQMMKMMNRTAKRRMQRASVMSALVRAAVLALGTLPRKRRH